MLRRFLAALLAVAALWPLAAQGLVRAGADPNAVLCGHSDWSQFAAGAQDDIRLIEALARHTGRERGDSGKSSGVCAGCLVAQTVLAPSAAGSSLPVCLSQARAEPVPASKTAPALAWVWDRAPRAPPRLA